MLEIIVTTHGTLAEGFKNASEVIVGQSDHIQSVGLLAGEDVEQFGLRLAETIQSALNPSGVIVLTDIVGASPYNQSLLAVSHLNPEDAENVYVIGGVSLPMLMEAINHQFLGTSASEAVAGICQQGSAEVTAWRAAPSTDSDEEEDEDF